MFVPLVVDDYDRETRITLWVASSCTRIETIEARTEMETGTELARQIISDIRTTKRGKYDTYMVGGGDRSGEAGSENVNKAQTKIVTKTTSTFPACPLLVCPCNIE